MLKERTLKEVIRRVQNHEVIAELAQPVVRLPSTFEYVAAMNAVQIDAQSKRLTALVKVITLPSSNGLFRTGMPGWPKPDLDAAFIDGRSSNTT